MLCSESSPAAPPLPLPPLPLPPPLADLPMVLLLFLLLSEAAVFVPVALALMLLLSVATSLALPARASALGELWERAWRDRSWATSSDASLAAFTARVLGMARREAANSPMASCSREPFEIDVSVYSCRSERLTQYLKITYNRRSPLFNIDVQRRFDSSATGHDLSAFQRPLDG